MKKVSLVLVFLCSFLSFGQEKWNSFSIEGGYGYVSPSNLYGSEFTKGDFSGFNHFDVGFRYMINPTFGLKLNYGRDGFSKGKAGNTFNSINLSAVYNVGSLFNLNYISYEQVGLLARVGFGVTIAEPKNFNKYERIGTATIGLTPQFKVSERLSVYGDLAYAIRFKQHYGFDGKLLNADYAPEVGKTTVVSFGLIVYLGKQKRHADWY